MNVARHVLVTGRVQGVFFRAWTREHAQSLEVTGWIRNRADGSVEAHLEGAKHAVERLLELLRTGPPGARVDNLEITPADIENNVGFAVRH